MHILIVENTPAIADTEAEYLRLIGADCDIASSGTEALELSEKTPYDAFILSVMLPEMNGFELCRTLRKSSLSPIIFVSACSDEASKIRAFSLGADDYMEKPFSGAELVARVRGHYLRYRRLRKNGMPVMNTDEDLIFKIRSLTIDKDRRTVAVGGTPITLTSKEFLLLEFLAEHPNRILSRADLYAAVWGEDSICEYSTVTVHIKRLREKIEMPGDEPKYIETIWGVGYRFIA